MICHVPLKQHEAYGQGNLINFPKLGFTLVGGTCIMQVNIVPTAAPSAIVDTPAWSLGLIGLKFPHTWMVVLPLILMIGWV